MKILITDMSNMVSCFLRKMSHSAMFADDFLRKVFLTIAVSAESWRAECPSTQDAYIQDTPLEFETINDFLRDAKTLGREDIAMGCCKFHPKKERAILRFSTVKSASPTFSPTENLPCPRSGGIDWSHSEHSENSDGGMPALHYACLNEATEPQQLLGDGMWLEMLGTFFRLCLVKTPIVTKTPKKVSGFSHVATQEAIPVTPRLFFVISALLTHGADPKAPCWGNVVGGLPF